MNMNKFVRELISKLQEESKKYNNKNTLSSYGIRDGIDLSINIAKRLATEIENQTG